MTVLLAGQDAAGAPDLYGPTDFDVDYGSTVGITDPNIITSD